MDYSEGKYGDFNFWIVTIQNLEIWRFLKY